jgi:hypothetical protein
MRNASPQDRLEERLKSERPHYEAPPGFTESVLSRLPSSQSRSLSRERIAFLPCFALAFALLALAGVFSFQFLRTPSAFAPVTANTTPAPAIADDLNIVLPNITSEQVQALSLKLDQPLEKELEYVISDARQAIQFVASNFLPEK